VNAIPDHAGCSSRVFDRTEQPEHKKHFHDQAIARRNARQTYEDQYRRARNSVTEILKAKKNPVKLAPVEKMGNTLILEPESGDLMERVHHLVDDDDELLLTNKLLIRTAAANTEEAALLLGEEVQVTRQRSASTHSEHASKREKALQPVDEVLVSRLMDRTSVRSRSNSAAASPAPGDVPTPPSITPEQSHSKPRQTQKQPTARSRSKSRERKATDPTATSALKEEEKVKEKQQRPQQSLAETTVPKKESEALRKAMNRVEKTAAPTASVTEVKRPSGAKTIQQHDQQEVKTGKVEQAKEDAKEKEVEVVVSGVTSDEADPASQLPNDSEPAPEEAGTLENAKGDGDEKEKEKEKQKEEEEEEGKDGRAATKTGGLEDEKTGSPTESQSTRDESSEERSASLSVMERLMARNSNDPVKQKYLEETMRRMNAKKDKGPQPPAVDVSHGVK
jgi:hypothetical protein